MYTAINQDDLWFKCMLKMRNSDQQSDLWAHLPYFFSYFLTMHLNLAVCIHITCSSRFSLM